MRYEVGIWHGHRRCRRLEIQLAVEIVSKFVTDR